MRLHDDNKLFKQAIQFTSQQKGIPEIYIEKDYWVTVALRTIFESSLRDSVVFKGGTSLQKCFSLINRFSEDIDLVIMKHDDESGNFLKRKLKDISQAVSKVLPEVDIDTITHKMGMNRKTAHTYSKEFRGEYGQVRDVIIIESTWLGYHEPFVKKNINSFISEMMINTGQSHMIEKYNLHSFEVNVLSPKRTLVEKIMSLIRFSYSESPLIDLSAKIRHVYDLHQVLQDKYLQEFFDSNEFDGLLLQVAKDDVVSFKSNNKWLANHPSEALIFNDLGNVWNNLESAYNGDFKKMVFGFFPASEDVFETLNLIKRRLVTVEWKVDV